VPAPLLALGVLTLVVARFGAGSALRRARDPGRTGKG